MSEEPSKATALEAQDLVNLIAPMLHGHEPLAQGAALADLVAIWIAGHFVEPADERHKLRQSLLEAHIALVRELIPVNEKMILERVRKEASS